MKNSTPSYGIHRAAVPLDTGYAAAAEAWDRRMGLATRNARLWRGVAVVALLTCLALSVGLAYAASRRQVEVYVAQIDPREARTLGVQLAGDRYTPNAGAKAYFVADVIRKSRGRILDPVAQNNRLREVYAFLAGPAEQRMNEYMANDPPAAADGRRVAREVEIGTMLQQGEDHYQVRWTERTYAGGRLAETADYTGLFAVTLDPPKDKRAILTNPLGLFVTDINWGRDFPANAPAKSPAAADVRNPK